MYLESTRLGTTTRRTSGTRFRGRDGGQCTTPAAPREERREEREEERKIEREKEGQADGKRNKEKRKRKGGEVDSSRHVYRRKI